MIAKLERTLKFCITKQGPNTNPTHTMGATINNEFRKRGPPQKQKESTKLENRRLCMEKQV